MKPSQRRVFAASFRRTSTIKTIAFLSNPQMVRIGVEEDRLLVEGSARSEITTSPSSGVGHMIQGFHFFAFAQHAPRPTGAVDPLTSAVSAGDPLEIRECFALLPTKPKKWTGPQRQSTKRTFQSAPLLFFFFLFSSLAWT